MNTIKRIFLFLCIVCLLWFSCENSNTSDIYEVGIAKVDITPPIGYPVHKVISEGVLDPLEAKTIVWSNGNNQAALIMADLFYIPLSLSELVREIASERTGIPVSNICLAATHTHADPTCYEDIEQYAERQKAGNLLAEDLNSYVARLVEGLAASVVEAKENIKETSFVSGNVAIEGVSFNRRHLMKDGTVRMNGGFLNPEIIGAVGPVDPELGVVLYKDKESGKPLLSFSTYAMQLATIGGTNKFSSGYPHFLETELQQHFDENFISVFGEGPCADVNHWDISKPGPQIGYDMATLPIGRKLAEGLIDNLPILKENKATLDVRNKLVEVPLQSFSEMDLVWAKDFKDKPVSALVAARIRKILSLEKLRGKYGDTMPVEIQVFKIGDETAIVTLPGQIFVELGLEIKKSSPFETTLIVTLANNHEECIPVKKAFAEGSYEVVYSLIDSGGGELLVDAALLLLNEMKNN